MSVVQAVLLFGSNMWVMTPQLKKSIEGSHHWVLWSMEGMGSKHQQHGTWIHTPIGAALAMVGMEKVGVYIADRQNTFVQYIANSPIIELWLAAEQKPGMRLSGRWWEQPSLDIMKKKEGHTAEEEGIRQGWTNQR